MTNEALQSLISTCNCPTWNSPKKNHNSSNITVPPEHLHQLMSQLKSNPETNFDYLFCLTGVDWEAIDGHCLSSRIIYHRHQLVVKMGKPGNPTFDTVSDIRYTADSTNGEVFELLRE